MSEMNDPDWWRSAVVYQIYPRSFADRDGDGVGDLGGVIEHLDYLADLGVDAVWLNPCYLSPMADAGYDVSDFRRIDPLFGDLDDFRSLVDGAHRRGLRVLMDLVPNHTSDQHPWFSQALASPPGSPERARYHFRDGRGDHGSEPPTDWISDFGGSSWTRTIDPDGTPGQWYLHLYAPQQPDLNWANPEVVDEFASILRFWFDRGIDGFRIDVAHGLAKDPHYADVGDLSWPLPADAGDDLDHPHWDRPLLHEIYRSWRRIADSYDPPRVFAGEIWVGRAHRLARYLRPDELHTAFNFDYLICPWRADLLRRTIEETLASHRSVGAPPTWVLSNHDVPRDVSRYARPQPDELIRLTLSGLLAADDGTDADVDLGRRRACAAAVLMLALPGSVYLYQGGELGLPEVEDIPDDQLQDPIFGQSGGSERGRDGCRVPMPWSGEEPPFGFGPPGSRPWLPQPAEWADVTVDAQHADPGSTLNLYRTAIGLRRSRPELGDGDLTWLSSPPGTLHFRRSADFSCLVNVDAEPVPLPPSTRVLLGSGPLTDDEIPAATAVWLTSSPE